MAGLGTHLWLAKRATQELIWPTQYQASLISCVCVNAFVNGCIAPDGGYFPGGVSSMADVAHYMNTGALCETLFKETADETMRLYSLGWVLHVLTDVEIHPLVNAAVGEIIHKSVGQAISFAQDPLGHARVETWLDSTIWGEHYLDIPECRHFMTTHDAETVARAFKKACSVRFRSTEIVKSQRAVIRCVPLLRRLGLFHAASQRQELRPYRGSFAKNSIGCLSASLGLLAGSSPLRGFIDVQPLPSRYLSEMKECFDRVLTRFQSLLCGPMSLPDYNLDTGLVEDSRNPYSLTLDTIRDMHRTGRYQGVTG